MSRKACVIHMSAVTLAQITRNAPSVVRKIYRPMDPMRFARPRSRRSLGAPGPLCPRQRHRCYSKAFFSLYLIGQQSGLAKAKPLTMHNKTLIRRLCPGRHRRLGEPGPGVEIRLPETSERLDRPGRIGRKMGPFPSFPAGRPDFCPLGARLIASAKPASTFPGAEFVHIREEIAPCLAAWSLNLCPSLHPLRAFLSCSAKRGSNSGLSRAVSSPQAVISRSGRRRPSGSKARTALRSTWLPRAGLHASRLVVLGVGKARDLKVQDFVKLGGAAMGKIPPRASEATVIADLPGGAFRPERAADMAFGVQLRAYAFERYKTKRKDDEEKAAKVRVKIAVARVAAAQKAFAPRAAVADGVVIARDLVNEPANVL